jgi:hypothetical protein
MNVTIMTRGSPERVTQNYIIIRLKWAHIIAAMP